MRIATRLTLISTSTMAGLVAMVLVVVWSLIEFKEAKTNNLIANEIKVHVLEGASARNQYFLHREEFAKMQWFQSKESIGSLTRRSELRLFSKDDQEKISRIRIDNEASGTLFKEILENAAALQAAKVNPQPYEERDKQLASLLLKKGTALRDTATGLRDASALRVEKAYQRLTLIVSLFAVSLALVVILSSMQIASLIRKRLVPLKAGVTSIAEGNLGFRLAIEGSDEFSELGQSINAMAEKLKVSNSQLGLEISHRTLLGAQQEALRKTNAYLENLINYANAPIIVWDRQFRITRFNHAFEFLTGRNEAEVLGQSLKILFPTESTENYMAMIRETSTGKRWESVEIKIQHRDGLVRTVLWNSATIFEPDGRTPLATIAQGQDISERNQMEERVRNLEKLSARGQMAAYIAHEINNPLAGIMNAFRLLEKAIPPDHPRRQYADIIRREMDRISNIVRTIYTVYRPYPKERAPARVNDVFRDLRLLLEPTMRSREVVINTTADPPDMVLTLPEGLLWQVLFNLVLNAVEASPRGGTVDLSATDTGGELVLTIADQGSGISPEDAPHLFEPGFTTKRGTEMSGLGLGLSTCQKLIESMDGTLEYHSNPAGCGTVFSVRFSMPGAAHET
jgi:PAS domain S-box-containing protein